MCKGVLMGINWLNVCIIISNNAGKRTSAKMQAETTKCVHQSENSTLSSRTCSESEPVGQRLDPHPWNSSRHPWLLECFYISNNLLYDRISPYAPGLSFWQAHPVTTILSCSSRAATQDFVYQALPITRSGPKTLVAVICSSSALSLSRAWGLSSSLWAADKEGESVSTTCCNHAFRWGTWTIWVG